MAKLTAQELIDAIKELSVLELNDLVKACEEEFGVSAAAGVVVAAAGPAEAAEEKTEFDVELTEVGAEKVKVISSLSELSQYSCRSGCILGRVSHCAGSFQILGQTFELCTLEREVHHGVLVNLVANSCLT